jgi:membrane protease YdiL (CAAX protease family)
MNPKLRLGDAMFWTFTVWFGMQLAVLFVLKASPAAAKDLVTLAGVQIVVFLLGCALFAARRSSSSWSELFALRPASPMLLGVSLLLGAAMTFPSEWLGALIQRAFPLDPAAVAELSERLSMRSPLHGAALFLVAAVLGPLVEELLFRGALFTGLRPAHTPAVAVVATAILFTMTHLVLQLLLPIAVLALLLGWLRAASGSLAPSLLMHVGYNGTTLGMAFAYGTKPESELPATWLVLGGLGSACVLATAAHFLTKKDGRAVEGRRLDGVLPAIPGETLS